MWDVMSLSDCGGDTISSEHNPLTHPGVWLFQVMTLLPAQSSILCTKTTCHHFTHNYCNWRRINSFHKHFKQSKQQQQVFLKYSSHLHSQMLQRHVLTVHVQGVVLGHGQHLLQVGLHRVALLVVDGVSVSWHWRTLVLTSHIGLRGVEPGVGWVGSLGWRRLTMRRGTVWRRMIDTLAYAAPGSPSVSQRLTWRWSVARCGCAGHIIHCYTPLSLTDQAWFMSLITVMMMSWGCELCDRWAWTGLVVTGQAGRTTAQVWTTGSVSMAWCLEKLRLGNTGWRGLVMVW